MFTAILVLALVACCGVMGWKIHILKKAMSAMILVEHAEALTRENTRLHLTVALSYGGRDEIASRRDGLSERARPRVDLYARRRRLDEARSHARR